MRQQLLAALKLSATQRLCSWSDGQIQDVAQRAILRWRSNRAEALGLAMAGQFEDMLQMMDNVRQAESTALARSKQAESEREVLRVRLSMMEDEFQALNGSAAWIQCNREQIESLLHEVPRLEARLAHVQHERELLASHLFPFLERFSTTRPDMEAMQQLAEQVKRTTTSTYDRCNNLERMHEQTVAEAQRCAFEAQQCV